MGATRSWGDYTRELGLALNRRRHELGLSQERLAHAAGITRFHYQQLEKGESKPGTPANPNLRTLVALSQVLETDLTQLLPPGAPDITAGR